MTDMINPIADPVIEIVDTDSQSTLVRLEASAAGVATVLINRAEKRNAFNSEVIAALDQAFETLEAADGVRAVFVRGAGGTFSAGADIAWMKQAANHTEADNREDALNMAKMLKRLHDLPMLTVALVEGAALGGGAGLAAACDMAIAVKDARFGFSEVKLGIVAATISPYVVAAIGRRRARALFATGAAFGTDAALHYGLIDQVVEDTAALEAARDVLAGELMACAPGAVGESKRLVDHVAGRAIDHGLMTETAHWIARVRVGPEAQEGLAAFLAGQKPGWAG
jgi:methylglutaconyl-CoA hydratase